MLVVLNSKLLFKQKFVLKMKTKIDIIKHTAKLDILNYSRLQKQKKTIILNIIKFLKKLKNHDQISAILASQF